MLEIFTPSSPLILVGCGNMGRAMAHGWLKAGLDPHAILIVDPGLDPDSIAEIPGSVPAQACFKKAEHLPAGITARALVIATKPQMMDAALPPLASRAGEKTLIVSVAAGVRIARFQQAFPDCGSVVRTMPNTPAAVGAGVSGLFALDTTPDSDRQIAGYLMSSVGQTVWVKKEDDLNAVTAVSGSGPAYVFHLVECMTAAGIAEGLDADTAMTLARQTVIGSGRLMEMQAEVPASILRQRVTSPGGTTAAALDILMTDDKLQDLMRCAVQAARKRGEKLG